MNIEEKDVLDGSALTELYQWIDAAQLTRPKKNIARDFSDGVLVAEIVHYYFPRVVDLHNYVVASSTGQKKINWNTLNRKVFTRMNIKLSDVVLNNVVEAKPGAIEQVLWDLRHKIMEQTGPSTAKKELSYTKSTGKMIVNSPRSKQSSVNIKSSNIQVGKRTSSRVMSSTSPLPVKASFVEKQLARSKPIIGKIVRDSAEKAKEPCSDSQINFPTLAEIPSAIVFKGHKMYAAELFEAKDLEIKELDNAKKQALTKIERLEKLIVIKDKRIDDLSHQNANLRAMYEQVTQGPFFKTETGDK